MLTEINTLRKKDMHRGDRLQQCESAGPKPALQPMPDTGLIYDPRPCTPH